MKIIPSKDFKRSTWSGGETTELYIFPEGEDFKERTFLFRISSASFTGTESVFSDFTGYQRYILPLEGSLWLAHTDSQGHPLYRRDLAPYEVDYFSGSWTTKSGNSLDCRDFNLIVREDLPAQLAVLHSGETYVPKRQGLLFAYSLADSRIRLGEGDPMDLAAGQLALVQEEDALFIMEVVSAESPLVVGEVGIGDVALRE